MKQEKSPWYFGVISLNNDGSFFYDKIILTFFLFGIIKKIICFSKFELVFETKARHISFSLIYKTLSATV